MDYVLGPGASYMEDDIRSETDEIGFRRTHYKKMYEYGNRTWYWPDSKDAFSVQNKRTP